MNMAEIMKEVSGWSDVEQSQLMGYLLQLRHQRDPQWKSSMADRIDDRDPAHWTSLETLHEKFKASPESSDAA
jgi:hypothetical protein